MAVTTATGREHKDGDDGGDCEEMTMEGGSHRSLEDRVLGGGGGDAACLTAGDRNEWEGERDCGNDGGMNVRDNYNNYEEEEKEEEDVVASMSLATTTSGRGAAALHVAFIIS